MPVIIILLLLGGELLTERCRTDDLMPSIPVPSLPPCRVDPKVLGLDVLIDRSEPGGSWTSNPLFYCRPIYVSVILQL